MAGAGTDSAHAPAVTRPRELLESASVVRRLPRANRVRLEVPALLGRPRLARALEQHLAEHDGVRRVRASAASGRVLVEHDRGASLVARLVRERPGRRRTPRGRAPLAAVQVGDAAGSWTDGRSWPWHALDSAEVLARLGSGRGGLDRQDAARRLARVGRNLFEEIHTRSRSAIVVGQLANLPTVMLLGAAGASLAFGEVIDAGVITFIVGLNAAIGYRMERKNEVLLASWRRLEAGYAAVLRPGAAGPVSVASADLVPGDVIVVAPGDVVPADARVLDGRRLAVDESALTGESEAQDKGPAAVAESAPLAERRSMLLSGTTVQSGRGTAVVVATGRATELAKVRALVEAARQPASPLERRLAALGRRATTAALASSVVVAGAGLIRRRRSSEVLRGAVALGVAAIPEGMPVTVTASLVRAMGRMRGAGVVVRRTSAVETLGGVTVICADKTGTLTENHMRLETLDAGGQRIPAERLRADPARLFEDPVTLALAAAILNSDVHRPAGRAGAGTGGAASAGASAGASAAAPVLNGSATECALIEAAERAGLALDPLRRRLPRAHLQARSDGVHYVVSVHRGPDGGAVRFVKGAPEQVLELCDRDLDRDGTLDQVARRRLWARNQALAGEGFRVLALAFRRDPPAGASAAVAPPGGFTFLGFAALRDPVRPFAADAVAAARGAGIRTLILTGDQKATAQAVARQVGLRGEALTGDELTALLARDPAAGLALASQVALVARVTPADKVAVVEALRRAGQVVAMAGDGINDAPALKAADVGIAVGVSSSDMARQTADVVLERSDLRTILAAVGEGRIVQDNLHRAIRFLFATNLSEVLLTLVGAVVGRPPLGPLSLLWINMLSDTLPALALAFEPGRADVLDRPPAPPGAPLFRPGELRGIARDGALMAALGGAATLGGPLATFAGLGAAQFGYAGRCRPPGTPPRARFTALVGGSAALHLAAVIAPGLRGLLGLSGAVAPALAAFGVGGAATLLWRRPGATRDLLVARPAAAPVRRATRPSAPGLQMEGGAA